MKIAFRLGAGFGALLAQPLAKERYLSDWYRNTSGGVLRTKAIARSPDAAMVAVFAAHSAKTSDELRRKIELLLETPREKALYAEAVAGHARSLQLAVSRFTVA